MIAEEMTLEEVGSVAGALATGVLMNALSAYRRGKVPAVAVVTVRENSASCWPAAPVMRTVIGKLVAGHSC